MAGSQLVVVSHSLGGLLTRYALGVLEEKGHLEGIELCSYMSLTAPHLGVQVKGARWHCNRTVNPNPNTVTRLPTGHHDRG